MTVNSRKGTSRKKYEINNMDFSDLFLQGINELPQFSALWFSRDGDMGMHFFGYKNVTEILLKWFFEPNDDNGTVYPLIFLLRHTVEIGLKESIRRATEIGSKKISLTEKEQNTVWKTHNLGMLTDLFNKVMEEYNISNSENWNKIVPYLQKWQAADPNATFGKYAVSTNGTPFNVKGNVYAGKLVAIGMDAIDFLEGVLAMLEEHQKIKGEIYHELRGDY